MCVINLIKLRTTFEIIVLHPYVRESAGISIHSVSPHVTRSYLLTILKKYACKNRTKTLEKVRSRMTWIRTKAS